MNVFETSGGNPHYLRRFAEEFLPTDACLLGDIIVIPGWRNERILHLFSEDGRHLRSFGAGLNANTSAAVREYANRAQLRVACDLGASRIYVTGVSTGIVRAYTPRVI